MNTRIRLRRDSSHFRSIQYENGEDNMNTNDDADDINTESNAREFCDNNDRRATYSCNEIRT